MAVGLALTPIIVSFYELDVKNSNPREIATGTHWIGG
jgi:hypothetical protein